MHTSRQAVMATLEATGVIAVVRIDRPADLPRLGRALEQGGVTMVEVTMTVPGAIRAIESTVQELGDATLVGAGTVLDPVTAREAIAAGASFIVSPALDMGVIAMAHLYDVACMPGCLTPTEIVQASAGGADAVKLFPGRVATPGYFRDLRGPFPHVKMLPTGNVDLETAPEYIRAGAIAVGVGKALVDVVALREGNWEAITEKAREFCKIVADAKGAK